MGTLPSSPPPLFPSLPLLLFLLLLLPPAPDLHRPTLAHPLLPSFCDSSCRVLRPVLQDLLDAERAASFFEAAVDVKVAKDVVALGHKTDLADLLLKRFSKFDVLEAPTAVAAALQRIEGRAGG